MSTIRPFKALRPPGDKAALVACVPYDVIYDEEVRELIGQNPLSFLRVTRPEGEFAAESTPPVKEVFERGRQNLERFIAESNLIEDVEQAIYVYRLRDGDHTQTGVVACCSISEYEHGSIKRHEKTRPDKVADRTEHMLAVGAQTGLVFLAFRGTKAIESMIADTVVREPLYHFDCPEGVGQTVWRITDTADWENAFSELPALYIADGHHRVESAKIARDRLLTANPHHTGDEQYNFFMAGMFPADDLRILPYNRVVKDLNGLDREAFFAAIREKFVLNESIEESPEFRGEISMYLEGEWFKLRLKPAESVGDGPIEILDVSLLQKLLLAPILGIGDPRTDTRISFVGGGRGTEELVRLVDAGEAEVAFSMYPTTINDLLSVADIDEIMPPKSTWFEPKLKDGLLIHKN